MFFYLSKIFWLVAEPTNALVLIGLLGVLLGLTRFRRTAWTLTASSLLGLAFAGAGPLGPWLLRPLEDRFPRPELATPPAGIIVLGGAIGTGRGHLTVNDSGGRMVEAAALALRFPEAKVVFTGGHAELLRDEEAVARRIEAPTEAEAARRYFLALGIAESRLILEDRSRNTRENAVFTRELIDPKPGETWLLVTSAWHMPRSVGIFRQVGLATVPFPADFRTRGTDDDWRRLHRGFSHGLGLTDLAAKEWIGLLAYRLAGYTDALFPAPPKTP